MASFSDFLCTQCEHTLIRHRDVTTENRLDMACPECPNGICRLSD